LGESIHTIQENAEALIVASKGIGLQVKADKSKYMVISQDQGEDTVYRFMIVPLNGWKSSNVWKQP
jgi:hypothetical protein